MNRSVIVSDRQDITRVGIESLVKKHSKDQLLICEAESKKEIVKLLTANPSSLIILDYTLSDFGSIDELLNTSARFSTAHWLLFSDDLSTDFLKSLFLHSENFSVVFKACMLDEINTALLHTLKGERFVCASVTNHLFLSTKATAEKDDNLLTSTEKEILKEIALGRTTKEIAANRNLSFHTVTTHRKNIFRKLDVNNVHEATKYAMRAGLIDLAEYYI